LRVLRGYPPANRKGPPRRLTPARPISYLPRKRTRKCASRPGPDAHRGGARLLNRYHLFAFPDPSVSAGTRACNSARARGGACRNAEIGYRNGRARTARRTPGKRRWRMSSSFCSFSRKGPPKRAGVGAWSTLCAPMREADFYFPKNSDLESRVDAVTAPASRGRVFPGEKVRGGVRAAPQPLGRAAYRFFTDRRRRPRKGD
jgi:hypothetical protein